MINIELTKEEKIKILKKHGFKIKTVTERFPSRFGGDEYKRMVDYVVTADGEYHLQPLGIDAGSDYYIDFTFKAIAKEKILNLLLAL
jgi:hypothetical protein